MTREIVRNVVTGQLGVLHMSTPMALTARQEVVFPFAPETPEDAGPSLLRVRGPLGDRVLSAVPWTKEWVGVPA